MAYIPISILQYAAVVVGGLLFGAVVLAKRLRTPKADGNVSMRSRLSLFGIAVQTASFFAAAVGRVEVSTPIGSSKSLILAAVVLFLGVAGAALFDRSARILGANWSLVARMRTDHQLVRDGPFARIRHPIYFAMLLMLAALGIGLGHIWGLVAAVPLFVIGTSIRIREEEKLLSAQFGEDHARYVREVPAFIPFIG
ncbi:MAG TPA: isoprenylcysteine carboxylmethyltransferase family protein [Sphingomicrobium sp.]|nr:isoprenylcysteine carboxylmethyltransferase family protein [Sphingomicrobium sp.]